MVEALLIEAARPDEWIPALSVLFQQLGDDEREERIDNALRLLRKNELVPEGVLVARDRLGMCGAMVCLPVAGASALVWPPQAARPERREEIEDQLLQHAHSWLRQRGTKLAQTLLSVHESNLAPPLERNGFRHITRLWYLRHTLKRSSRQQTGRPRLSYQSYNRCDRSLFHETLLRTYEQTRDCPEVNGVRDLEEILEGHRAQGEHDPERWWLAFDAAQPLGVLLLTHVPEWRGWDISYLGVVPDCRRRGAGREMTQKAIREAALAGAAQLSLAVDARNQPAWNLYTGLGFEAFDQREVYLAIW